MSAIHFLSIDHTYRTPSKKRKINEITEIKYTIDQMNFINRVSYKTPVEDTVFGTQLH